jgi:hypothetical protein
MNNKVVFDSKIMVVFPKEFEHNSYMRHIEGSPNKKRFILRKDNFVYSELRLEIHDVILVYRAVIVGLSDIMFSFKLGELINCFSTDYHYVLCGSSGGSPSHTLNSAFRIKTAYKIDRGVMFLEKSEIGMESDLKGTKSDHGYEVGEANKLSDASKTASESKKGKKLNGNELGLKGPKSDYDVGEASKQNSDTFVCASTGKSLKFNFETKKAAPHIDCSLSEANAESFLTTACSNHLMHFNPEILKTIGVTCELLDMETFEFFQTCKLTRVKCYDCIRVVSDIYYPGEDKDTLRETRKTADFLNARIEVLKMLKCEIFSDERFKFNNLIMDWFQEHGVNMEN